MSLAAGCFCFIRATLFSATHSNQTTLGLLFNGVMISTFTLQLIIPVLYSQRSVCLRSMA